MANKSTYLANAELNAALRNASFSAPSTIYLALFTTAIAAPAGTGGTECSGGGYARLALASAFSAASSGATSNPSPISFSAATTPGWGTVVGWGLYDASTSGNLLYYGTLNGTNDVQTITTTGTPTGGTFTLTFGGQTTPALPYNATAAQIQEYLESLTSIGGGNVACTGGSLPTGVVVTFQGTLGNASQTPMTHTDSLTGGSTPAVAIAHTTTGSTGNLVVGTGATVSFASTAFAVSES